MVEIPTFYNYSEHNKLNMNKLFDFICDTYHQGECGYGPNVLVDGKLFNGIKAKDDIVKVLGLEDEQ